METTGSIGRNIYLVRKEKALSQQTLASKCEISNTTLSLYENGKKTPNLYTIAKIARNLGVSIDRLYYGDENMMFINTAPNDGRKIVNAIYLLWERKVIYMDGIFKGHPYGLRMNLSEKEQFDVYISRYPEQIVRLLKGLEEFSFNKNTYPDPAEYLEQFLASVAKSINDCMDQKI